MKIHALAAAALLLALPFAANASADEQEESPISWEVSAVSDYLFRGVSQTNEKPTLQGNLTWTSSLGLYVGSSVSGVDFGEGGPHTEVDYTVGYGHSLGESVALDVSLNRYTYLGAREQNYNELITTATFAETYNVTVGYSSNAWNSGSTGLYYGVGAEWALPKDFSLSANVGRSVFRDPEAVELEDYTDWGVAVGKTFGMVNVSLGYFGTDSTAREMLGKTADNRVLLKITLAH